MSLANETTVLNRLRHLKKDVEDSKAFRPRKKKEKLTHCLNDTRTKLKPHLSTLFGNDKHFVKLETEIQQLIEGSDVFDDVSIYILEVMDAVTKKMTQDIQNEKEEREEKKRKLSESPEAPSGKDTTKFKKIKKREEKSKPAHVQKNQDPKDTLPEKKKHHVGKPTPEVPFLATLSLTPPVKEAPKEPQQQKQEQNIDSRGIVIPPYYLTIQTKGAKALPKSDPAPKKSNSTTPKSLAPQQPKSIVKKQVNEEILKSIGNITSPNKSSPQRATRPSTSWANSPQKNGQGPKKIPPPNVSLSNNKNAMKGKLQQQTKDILQKELETFLKTIGFLVPKDETFDWKKAFLNVQIIYPSDFGADNAQIKFWVDQALAMFPPRHPIITISIQVIASFIAVLRKWGYYKSAIFLWQELIMELNFNVKSPVPEETKWAKEFQRIDELCPELAKLLPPFRLGQYLIYAGGTPNHVHLILAWFKTEKQVMVHIFETSKASAAVAKDFRDATKILVQLMLARHENVFKPPPIDVTVETIGCSPCDPERDTSLCQSTSDCAHIFYQGLAQLASFIINNNEKKETFDIGTWTLSNFITDFEETQLLCRFLTFQILHDKNINLKLQGFHYKDMIRSNLYTDTYKEWFNIMQRWFGKAFHKMKNEDFGTMFNYKKQKDMDEITLAQLKDRFLNQNYLSQVDGEENLLKFEALAVIKLSCQLTNKLLDETFMIPKASKKFQCYVMEDMVILDGYDELLDVSEETKQKSISDLLKKSKTGLKGLVLFPFIIKKNFIVVMKHDKRDVVDESKKNSKENVSASSSSKLDPSSNPSSSSSSLVMEGADTTISSSNNGKKGGTRRRLLNQKSNKIALTLITANVTDDAGLAKVIDYCSGFFTSCDDADKSKIIGRPEKGDEFLWTALVISRLHYSVFLCGTQLHIIPEAFERLTNADVLGGLSVFGRWMILSKIVHFKTNSDLIPNHSDIELAVPRPENEQLYRKTLNLIQQDFLLASLPGLTESVVCDPINPKIGKAGAQEVVELFNSVAAEVQKNCILPKEDGELSNYIWHDVEMFQRTWKMLQPNQDRKKAVVETSKVLKNLDFVNLLWKLIGRKKKGYQIDDETFYPSGKDFMSVYPSSWISDTIIDMYLAFLALNKLDVIVFHASAVTSGDFEKICENIIEFYKKNPEGKALIPIYDSNHWHLTTVKIQDNKLGFFNPYQNDQSTTGVGIAKAILDVLNLKLQEINRPPLVLQIVKNAKIPHQKYPYECGAFMLGHAKTEIGLDIVDGSLDENRHCMGFRHEILQVVDNSTPSQTYKLTNAEKKMVALMNQDSIFGFLKNWFERLSSSLKTLSVKDFMENLPLKLANEMKGANVQSVTEFNEKVFSGHKWSNSELRTKCFTIWVAHKELAENTCPACRVAFENPVEYNSHCAKNH